MDKLSRNGTLNILMKMVGPAGAGLPNELFTSDSLTPLDTPHETSHLHALSDKSIKMYSPLKIIHSA